MLRAGQPRRLQQAARILRFALGALEAPAIATLVSAAAARYGLDPALVLAIARRESGLDPNAVSRKGAQGVMQLMPDTARSLGVTNPFDPGQNINAGVRYLRQLVDQFGDLVKGVAAYDWGPGRVSAAIEQYGENWLGAAPAETKEYVRDILGVEAPTSTEAPLTIDAATGQLIPSSVDVAQLPYAQASVAQGLTPQRILLLTAFSLGAYLLADFLQE